MNFFFVIIIFVVSFCSLTFSQSNDSLYKYWMTIGFMFDRDVRVNFDYSFSFHNSFYKIGYLAKGTAVLGGFEDDHLKIKSVDFSIGRRFQSKWFQAAFFAGPAYIFGEKLLLAPYSIKKFNSVGIKSDIQLLFRLANEVGIGVGLYGNLNPIKNYAGINLNITLGNGR